jgi:hypothetical protein
VFAGIEFRGQKLEIDDVGRGKEMPTLMPLTSPALFMWQLKMPMMIAGKNEGAASRQQASSRSQLSHLLHLSLESRQQYPKSAIPGADLFREHHCPLPAHPREGLLYATRSFPDNTFAIRNPDRTSKTLREHACRWHGLPGEHQQT